MTQEFNSRQIIEFVTPHLNGAELMGFARHLNGQNPGSADFIVQAGGWRLYWGFSDALAQARTFPDLADGYYDRGYALGAQFRDRGGDLG